jgi:tetratricopeptide (TPR) repeat protein
VNNPDPQAKPSAAGNIPGRIRAYLDKQWIRCLLIGLVGFVVRIPALPGEPLWDDDYLIRTNPFIKSPLLVLEVFRHYLFPEASSSHYRPVQNISYMADYLLWNGNFYGFHVSSVLWHVLAGILLYLLLRRLFRPLLGKSTEDNKSEAAGEESAVSSWLAFFVALVWVVHPVHSAAVDYVSGRADSLAVCFGSGGWLLFLKARELRSQFFRVTLFCLAWLTGLLALCSRESACLWPALFLVYLFAFERPKTAWKKAAIIGACLLMLATYFELRQLPVERPGFGSSSHWPASFRSVLMLRALGDYGRLMIFPSNLHMERTVYSPAAFQNEKARWNAIGLEYLSIGGLIVLSGLILLGLRRGQGQRARIFGAAWFLLAYLPISNLIELNATVAEHWLYLPSVGFLIFAAGCWVEVPPRLRRLGVAVACVAVIGLGVRSAYRSSDWVSNETFARQTIRSGGLSIRIALMLGQVYTSREDYAQAERILRKALEMCPDYPIARNNLADALIHQGKEKEAEALFTQSTKTAHESMKDYPRTWIAALNLSHLRHTQNNDAEAIAVLEKARQDYPDTWELIGSESELLRSADKVDAALDIVRPYAQQNWWHYKAWLAFGRLLAQKGDNNAAAATLRHASWLDLHETAALNLMALVRMGQNRFEDAWRMQRIALSRQPDQPRQYLLLSNILDKMGRADEARAALAQVSRLRTLADSEKVVN